ncbi:LexA repressor [Usitatibacter rugosus]|uniref:LexA repressor n=1 Tax=Usitatibacter rugosus TaxID=2732067 RepID=A0A6M4GWY3_9PROT|nr:transcriptional repressor LexA [Usitatibacter rugosus]QJR11014.1 LexA repressor [Usitatibacter rugosus]
METPPLTPRQAEILEAIRTHISETGRPPSQPELSRVLGIASTNAVFKHLAALAKKGAIELAPNVARGIRVVEESGMPLIGHVAAGSPMMAIENMLGRYPVDPSLFSPRADYLLQVRGLSMRDEGILDGDWVVVHKTTQAKNGQLVIARVGDDVTVKRFRIRGNKAELIPANPDFQTLHFDLTRQPLAIEGVAVGVIRNLGARLS